MALISEIVQVTISVQDASVAQASFNKILFAAYHTVGAEKIRDYTDNDDVATDYASWPGVLAAATAFFAQSPRPTTLAIGRLLTASTKKYKITPTAANSTQYQLTFKSAAGTETASYTSDGTATVAEICAGLTTAINLTAGLFTAVNNTTYVEVDADSSGYWFSAMASTAALLLAIQEVTTGGSASIAAELAGIANERDGWYGLVVQDHDETTVANVAAYAETVTKVYGTSTSDPDSLTTSTTDVLSDLETAAYKRTFALWHQDPQSYPEMAWMSEEFPYTPGSRTWFAKQLSGISASDSYLSATNVTNLSGKQANTIRSFGGIAITKGGTMASGRFIDVTLGTDWLTARMQERVLAKLINLPKVPYTDAGLVVLENEVRAQVQEAITEQVLADDENIEFSTTAVADQNPNDRTARIVRGVNFKARLAGAVHNVFIQGVVTA